MRIIVTGGAGYIGSHTVVELANAGHDVVIVDDLSNSHPRVLPALAQLLGFSPAFYKTDLADPQAANAFFEACPESDAVVHFAAYLSVSESVADPVKYYHNNLCSLINVLRGMEKRDIRSLVFSSSCTVYGQPEHFPVSEDAPVLPAGSPYGSTKQMSEKILEDTARAGRIRATSLRYFNPIGAHDSALIGELPMGVPHHLVPYITQTASGRRPFLRVFGSDYPTPDGTAIRDYLHVVDLAKAHVRTVEYLQNEQTQPWEVFNLGTGQGASVLEMIQAFERATGIGLPYRFLPRRAGDVVQVWADTTRANNILGWRTERDLENMMATAWAWEKHLQATGWYETTGEEGHA